MLLEIWTQRGQQGISGAPAVTKNSYTDTLLLGKTILDVTETRWAPQGGNKLRWLERSNGNNFRDKFPWRMAVPSEGKLKFTTFFFGEAWSGCCATVAARTARLGDQKWCFGDPTEQRLHSKYASLSTNFERWERESPGKRHLLYKNQVGPFCTVVTAVNRSTQILRYIVLLGCMRWCRWWCRCISRPWHCLHICIQPLFT